VEDIDEIVLVGRGDSVEDFDWPDLPIGCVSSAIFLKCLPRKPDYWILVDGPRWFIESHKQWTWKHDPKTEWWDACGSQIPKHVPFAYPKGHPLMDLFAAPKGHNQPDPNIPCPPWSDYPNVTYWGYQRRWPIYFGDGVLGGSGFANSITFALQVVYRLGFRRIRFAGVDFADPAYVRVRGMLNQLRERSPLEWPELKGEE
jgi:hypothetical protein